MDKVKQNLIDIVNSYSFASERQKALVNEVMQLNGSSVEQIREYVNQISSQVLEFQGQLYAPYLNETQIYILNAIVNAVGSLKVCCLLYDYKHLYFDSENTIFAFDSREVKDKDLQAIFNMMHVLYAKESCDPEYRARKGLPPLEDENLSAQEIMKSIPKAEDDPYAGLDGQDRYIKGMEVDKFNFVFCENHNIDGQAIVDKVLQQVAQQQAYMQQQAQQQQMYAQQQQAQTQQQAYAQQQAEAQRQMYMQQQQAQQQQAYAQQQAEIQRQMYMQQQAQMQQQAYAQQQAQQQQMYAQQQAEAQRQMYMQQQQAQQTVANNTTVNPVQKQEGYPADFLPESEIINPAQEMMQMPNFAFEQQMMNPMNAYNGIDEQQAAVQAELQGQKQPEMQNQNAVYQKQDQQQNRPEPTEEYVNAQVQILSIMDRFFMGDIMALKELVEQNPLAKFYNESPDAISKVLFGVKANTEEKEVTLGFKVDDICDEVKPEPSKVYEMTGLVMTKEEEAEHFYILDNDKIGKLPTLQETMDLAARTMHPNDPRMYQDQMLQPAPGNVVNGVPLGFALMGAKMPPQVMPQQFPMQQQQSIPNPFAGFRPNAQQQAEAESVKAQLKQMGIKTHSLKELNGNNTQATSMPEPPSQTAIDIANQCSNSDGDEIRLGRLNASMVINDPVDADMDGYTHNYPPGTPEFFREIKEYGLEVRRRIQERQKNGYRPKNVTIYDQKHPNGIHNTEPGFAEAKKEFDIANGFISPEPMTNESLEKLRSVNFKDTVEANARAMQQEMKAVGGPEEYTKLMNKRVEEKRKIDHELSQGYSPLGKARQQADAKRKSTPGYSYAQLMGMGVQGGAQVDRKAKYPHIPDNVDSLVVPSYFNPNMRRDWLITTQEEVDAGLACEVFIVRNDEEKEAALCKIKEAEERLQEQYKSYNDALNNELNTTGIMRCTSKEFKEFEKKREENFETILTKMDYKEASVLNQIKKANDEDYQIANELSRYNTSLADEFLWYKKNKSYDEFLPIRREIVDQLILYRAKDPLANTKMRFKSIGDDVLITEPMKYSMEDLEKYAAECKKKAEECSMAGKEKRIIESYQKQADIINKEAREKAGIEDDNSVRKTMRQLQSLRNLTIVSSEDDRGITMVTEKEKYLSRPELDAKNQYKIFKKIKRSCYSGDPNEFDKEFDEWWYGPTVYKTKLDKWLEYKRGMAGLVSNYLTMVEDSQPSQEQITRAYRDATYKAWHEFDQGHMRLDMSLGEFLSGFQFLETRCLEEKLDETVNSMKSLYDPRQYMALVTKSAIEDANRRGEQYSFTDSKEYNERRQKFIDTIFHNVSRGTIS